MSEVRITNREIYDLVQSLDRKLTEHMASTEVRLTHLEARAGRPWQLWLALAGTTIGLPLAAVAAALGLS